MRNSFIVIGLGYGDEGKGSWVDHLVREHDIKYVVRFNGGAQAAHHVVTPDDRSHCFAQFGAGTLVPGVQTCLSRFMLTDPEALLKESTALQALGVKDPLTRMIISENAPVITPFNRLLNRIQECYRGSSRHGSCGFGIGITQSDVERLGERALYVRDLRSSELRNKLQWLWEQRVEEAKQFSSATSDPLRKELEHVDLEFYIGLFQSFTRQVQVVSEEEFAEIVRENDMVFEGAQGVLLDQCYGFYPNCTRTNCTFQNAEEILDEAEFAGEITRVGLLRGYGTRHGAGPFVTEDTGLKLPACHNGTNAWQGSFRLGWFDAVAARYALEAVGGVDTLAITNLDRMSGLQNIKVCNHYDNADPHYFTGSRINLLPVDYPLLARRTESMKSIVPLYRETSGWSKPDESMLRYIETLSEVLDHAVHAYSDSIDHHKHYISSERLLAHA